MRRCKQVEVGKSADGGPLRRIPERDGCAWQRGKCPRMPGHANHGDRPTAPNRFAAPPAGTSLDDDLLKLLESGVFV